MASDIKKDVIKKTQEMLTKHINAPPLTEKLLSKPPFRYLHDIVTNIIKETGYLENIFLEQELKSENVKEKDAKIAFLQKLIAEVKNTTKRKLAVRPSKIIAGLEPTETNLLLQAIAEGAESKKLNPSTAIKKTAIAKPVTKASPREKKEDVAKKKVAKPSTSTGNLIKKAEVQKISPKSKPQKTVASAVKKSKSDKSAVVSKPLSPPEGSTTALLNSNEVGNSTLNETINEDNTITVEETKEIEKEDTVKIEDKTDEDHLKDEDLPREFNESKTLNDNKDLQKTEQIIPQEITKIYATTTTTTRRRPPTATKATQERPKTSLRPPSVRPMSARPGAPKIRDKQDATLPVEEVVSTGQVQVIVEDFNARDADEEETVVIKAVPEAAAAQPAALHPDIPNEQGHLVSQILQQLDDDDVEITKPREEIVMRPGEISKELEQLRNSIQTLTKAANPLGKLMNYLQEDVEAMYDELVTWRNINVQIRKDVLKHKQNCENAMKPLKTQLQELEENIQKQQEEIFIVRSNISNNKQTIERLLVPQN